MTDKSEPAGADPAVLLLCDDFFVIPRLQDAARAAGLTPVVIDHPQALDAEGDPAPRRVPITEPLEGSDARFLRGVVDQQPALMVFDLSSIGLALGSMDPDPDHLGRHAPDPAAGIRPSRR